MDIFIFLSLMSWLYTSFFAFIYVPLFYLSTLIYIPLFFPITLIFLLNLIYTPAMFQSFISHIYTSPISTSKSHLNIYQTHLKLTPHSPPCSTATPATNLRSRHNPHANSGHAIPRPIHRALHRRLRAGHALRLRHLKRDPPRRFRTDVLTAAHRSLPRRLHGLFRADGRFLVADVPGLRSVSIDARTSPSRAVGSETE